MASRPWFVYVVECSDGSLYTGVALDVARRIAVHNQGKGAKYTRGRRPVELLAEAGPLSRGDALRLEREIKQLPRGEKLAAVRARGLEREGAGEDEVSRPA